MNNSEKAEITTLIRHIEKFSKSGIDYDIDFDLRFRGPTKDGQKNSGNCKVLLVTSKHNNSTKLLFPVMDFLVKRFW